MIETILVFALIPLAIYGLAGILTLRSKSARIPRHRPGQPWPYAAQWWSANLTDLESSSAAASASAARSEDASHAESSAEKSALAAGGARGNW